MTLVQLAAAKKEVPACFHERTVEVPSLQTALSNLRGQATQLSLVQQPRLSLQQWREKVPPTGRNLKQDQAHIGDPPVEGWMSEGGGEGEIEQERRTERGEQ